MPLYNIGIVINNYTVCVRYKTTTSIKMARPDIRIVLPIAEAALLSKSICCPLTLWETNRWSYCQSSINERNHRP